MHFNAKLMFEEGPDEDDQARGYLTGTNDKMYWVDPDGIHLPLLYDEGLREFRRMTHAENAAYLRSSFIFQSV